MPKTAFQKTIFGTLMALAMVYGMEVYNTLVRNGGFSGTSLVVPARELVLLCAIVIALETLIGGPVARNLAFRLVDAANGPRMATILPVSIFTVCTMCPMMSLVAVALFKGLDREVVSKWTSTTLLNLPMAFGWQLLVAGPLVRLLFRKLFAPESQPSERT